MDRLHLGWDDYREYLRTIRWTHERRIHVRVLDLEHNVLSSLTPRFVEGEVTGDVTRDVSRVATMKFLDPSRSIHFEPDGPSSIPVHRRRMLQVGYSVRVPALAEWVTSWVCTGPVFDFERTGPLVSLTVHGKERLMLDQAGRHRVFPRKTKKTRILRELFADAGETNLSIPDLAVTSPERVVVGRMASRWPIAERVAHSMTRDLFYNGSGTAVLRNRSERPVFTFDDRTLMSDVTIGRDPENLHNTWEVTGADPKGPKPKIRAVVDLPDRHPLSSSPVWGLGRNGQRSYLIEQYENPHFKHYAEALAKARKMRDDGRRLLTNYTFDSLPIPHLEENDLVRVVTDEGTYLVRMSQWTLPLTLEGSPAMTVGALRRTTTGRPGRGAA